MQTESLILGQVSSKDIVCILQVQVPFFSLPACFSFPDTSNYLHSGVLFLKSGQSFKLRLSSSSEAVNYIVL